MAKNEAGRFVFDPSALRHRISVYKTVPAQSEPWGNDPTFALIAELWAGMLSASSAEREAADQLSNRRHYKFVVRHRADLGEVTRIMFGTRKLDLVSHHDPDGTGRWLILEAGSILGDDTE